MQLKISCKHLGWLTWSQSIYWWQQVKLHNHNPIHDLPQTYRGSKDVYPIWIWTTDKFLTHLSTSLNINKFLSSKFNKHKSTINKRRPEQITWRIFYINKMNQLMRTIMNTQPAPSPIPSTNLQGKQIRISNFDTSHTQFVTHPGTSFRINKRLSY